MSDRVIYVQSFISFGDGGSVYCAPSFPHSVWVWVRHPIVIFGPADAMLCFLLFSLHPSLLS